MPTPSAPSTARRLLMGLIVAGAVLLLAELGLRGLLAIGGADEPPPQTEDAMRSSPLLGWVPRPGANRAFGVPRPTWIDGNGTRNPEPMPPPAPRELRVLTLGDSTVYGVLIDDPQVFGAVAAEELTRRTGRPVRTINGGVPGYTSEQALRLYEVVLADEPIDIVVIGTLWSDSQLGAAPDALLWPRSRAGLVGHLQDSGLVRGLGLLLAGVRDPEVIAWRLSPAAGVRRVPPGAFRHNLHRLAEVARSRGAEPVFLRLPSDRDLRGVPLEPPRPTYRALMAQVAEEEGALLIDGATPFEGGDPNLMIDDVHPSNAGHRLLGRAVAAGLEDVVRAR